MDKDTEARAGAAQKREDAKRRGRSKVVEASRSLLPPSLRGRSYGLGWSSDVTNSLGRVERSLDRMRAYLEFLAGQQGYDFKPRASTLLVGPTGEQLDIQPLEVDPGPGWDHDPNDS